MIKERKRTYTQEEVNELKKWFDSQELPPTMQIDKAAFTPNLKDTVDMLFEQAYVCYENPKIDVYKRQVDGFAYQEAEVPVNERPEIDRWILSVLNSLVKNVDACYNDYEPTKACLLYTSAQSIMKPLMPYVDVCIGNEEDAELCLGFKPEANVEAGETNAEGYKGIFKACLLYTSEDCWIGGGAILCPGVKIGHRCIIGAGSVVTKDIPDNSVAVGNPAKVIRKVD